VVRFVLYSGIHLCCNCRLSKSYSCISISVSCFCFFMSSSVSIVLVLHKVAMYLLETWGCFRLQDACIENLHALML